MNLTFNANYQHIPVGSRIWLWLWGGAVFRFRFAWCRNCSHHRGSILHATRSSQHPRKAKINFEDVYFKRWGLYPSGPVYDAYALVRAFRDGLQKAMWVSKDNPNADKIIAAMEAMVNDPVSMASINKTAGKYPWVVGDAAQAHTDAILNLVQEDALRDLVTIANEQMGLASVYKPELIK